MKNSSIAVNESNVNLEAKDQYGIMLKLNREISKKYEVIEMVGNGSYGTVMKAKCHTTG